MKGCDVRRHEEVSRVSRFLRLFLRLHRSVIQERGRGEEKKEGEDTRYSERVSRVPLIGDRG